MAEPVFNEYLSIPDLETTTLKRKRELYDQESAASWASAAESRASPKENLAAEIVFRLREDERDHLFGNQASEAIPRQDTRDMGGQYLTNLDRIKQSRLFAIAQRMPKGAHLHIHFNTQISGKAQLEYARTLGSKEGDGLRLFFKTDRPLSMEKDFQDAEIGFEALPKNTPCADVFDEQYRGSQARLGKPVIWMAWDDFCREYLDRRIPGTMASPTEWALSKLHMRAEDVHDPLQTLNGVWAKFNQITRGFKGFLHFESALRKYVHDCIDSMIADGIMYAELRPMLMDTSIPSDDNKRQLRHAEQMQLITEELAKKRTELEREGKLDKFPFGFKIIYCAPRSIPREKLRGELQMCIKLKQEFPDLICGFDLVGAEDRLNPIGFYQKELLAFSMTCKQLNLNIPFLFHAGESLLDTAGTKSCRNSNIYDALLLDSKRIGHGVSLLKHPSLIPQFRERNICIELCPTSNETLHLCRNIKEHPFPLLLDAGIPCTLNSDNPMLISSSLSLEFYQVMVGSFKMNLHGWRQLAEWSIEHSRLSKSEKERATAIFSRNWEDFCEWIINNFSG